MKVSRKSSPSSKLPVIRTIGIVLKEKDPHALNLLKRLSPLLATTRRRFRFLIEGAAKSHGPSAKLHQITAKAQIILVLGGDGTLLRCAKALLEKNAWQRCYLLGFNAGHLGFLTFVNQSEAQKCLESTLEKPAQARTERRACLEIRVERKGKVIHEFHALNDCVLTKGSLSRLFEFHIEVDRQFLSSYRADGLIISTPTGSTAYNLAAGGSIVEPNIPAMQLTPVCAQSLTSKPIVISDSRAVTLSLGRHSTDVYLTIDGHTGLQVLGQDRIHITKSRKSIGFLVPPNISSLHYFQSLRQKLKWGSSLAWKASP